MKIFPAIEKNVNKTLVKTYGTQMSNLLINLIRKNNNNLVKSFGTMAST